MAFERQFVLALPFGTCVGVSLPAGPARAECRRGFTPSSGVRARAAGGAARRGVGRWKGRAAGGAGRAGAVVVRADAVHAARRARCCRPAPWARVEPQGTICRGDRAPTARPRATIGIDVEDLRPLRTDIAAPRAHVRRAGGAAAPTGPPATRPCCAPSPPRRRSTRRSIPWVHRFVGFQEAPVARAPDGSLTAALALGGGEGPFSVELRDLGDVAGQDHAAGGRLWRARAETRAGVPACGSPVRAGFARARRAARARDRSSGSGTADCSPCVSGHSLAGWTE